MPRRRPSAVRADLPFHPRRKWAYSVVDGVSAGTLRQIRGWEHLRRDPGAVARDLDWWRRQAAVMRSRRWHGSQAGIYYYGYLGCECCDYDDPPRRWGLEAALSALPRKARRELRGVVQRIDARVLAATYGADTDIPGWWETCV